MLPPVNAEGIEDDAGALGRDLTLECGPDVILKSGLYMRGQFIGKASRDTGPSIDTIRFYEKVGLIEHPARTNGEFRIFGVRDTRELHLIRKMLKLMAVTAVLARMEEPRGRAPIGSMPIGIRADPTASSTLRSGRTRS